MTGENYMRCMMYEILIKRAYKSEVTSRNGGHLSNMRNLIDAENGIKHYKHATADKQLEKVKGYLTKAVHKFRAMKMTDEEKASLTHIQQLIDNAYSSDELLSIVDNLLDLTDRFK